MEERETGVTFSEIFNAIKRRFLIVLCATLVLTAVFVVAVHFGYNAATGYYELTVALSYPADGEGKYPDGTPFYYQDIVSLSALSATKQSNERFSSINVEKLVEKDAISISQGEDAGEYTLSARAAYFPDRNTATEFFKELGRRFKADCLERARALSYSLDETAFTGADFEGKIALLTAQRDDILAQYDEWIALYRSGYSVSGKTLSNYRAEVDVLFGTAMQEALKSELETSGYVPLDLLETKRETLEAEKALNARQIEELTKALGNIPNFLPDESSPSGTTIGAGNNSYPDLSETLAALIVRNVQIDSQISVLTEANVRNFENRLKSEYTKLQRAAENTQAVGVALYEQETRVTFKTARAAQSGGMNLILAGVGGLVLAFIAVSFVVCMVEIPKSRKKEEGKERAEETKE